ncbi:MAG: class I SAM-dependent methyltransferase [Pirellulaceae bacterium]|nr:class I SAM-dependent methyltransferase [Pirellulaceae bacterium]
MIRSYFGFEPLEYLVREKAVLEIGCGAGQSSVILFGASDFLGIDIDNEAVSTATASLTTACRRFIFDDIRESQLDTDRFDVTVFMNSLHHIPSSDMSHAIAEAIRVTNSGGILVFVEPAFDGSLFEAEKRFNCIDGDERTCKVAAYKTILSCDPKYEVDEFFADTYFQFDSMGDFIAFTKPRGKGILQDCENFLANHDFCLHARRRINIVKNHRWNIFNA